MRVLEEIERCDCPHFLILFRWCEITLWLFYAILSRFLKFITFPHRDSKLQFRGLYAYYPDTDEVFKIYGTGPRQVLLIYSIGLTLTWSYLWRWPTPWSSDITSITRAAKNSLRFGLWRRKSYHCLLFFQIHTKHLTVTIDAFTIHNRYQSTLKQKEIHSQVYPKPRQEIIQFTKYDTHSLLLVCGWERKPNFRTRKISPW